MEHAIPDLDTEKYIPIESNKYTHTEKHILSNRHTKGQTLTLAHTVLNMAPFQKFIGLTLEMSAQLTKTKCNIRTNIAFTEISHAFLAYGTK